MINVIYYFFLFLIIANCSIDYSSNIFRQKTKRNVMTNQEIDIPLVKDALKDLFVISAKMVSIDNIQKTVAEYYNIKLSDLLSKRRSRSITRPRQLAMSLTKRLTNHSLPEIGEAFNGRDHTTVIHACNKIKELRVENSSLEEDYKNLIRSLTN